MRMNSLTNYILIFLLWRTAETITSEHCAEYLSCRANVLQEHLKCSEKWRKQTATVCNLETDYSELQLLTLRRENAFSICIGRESTKYDGEEIEEREERENREVVEETRVEGVVKLPVHCSFPLPLPPSISGCSDSFAGLIRSCDMLRTCCAESDSCMQESASSWLTSQLRKKRVEVNIGTMKCRSNMRKVMETNVTSDDLSTASDVFSAADHLMTSLDALPDDIEEVMIWRENSGEEENRRKKIVREDLSTEKLEKADLMEETVDGDLAIESADTVIPKLQKPTPLPALPLDTVTLLTSKEIPSEPPESPEEIVVPTMQTPVVEGTLKGAPPTAIPVPLEKGSGTWKRSEVTHSDALSPQQFNWISNEVEINKPSTALDNFVRRSPLYGKQQSFWPENKKISGQKIYDSGKDNLPSPIVKESEANKGQPNELQYMKETRDNSKLQYRSPGVLYHPPTTPTAPHLVRTEKPRILFKMVDRDSKLRNPPAPSPPLVHSPSHRFDIYKPQQQVQPSIGSRESFDSRSAEILRMTEDLLKMLEPSAQSMKAINDVIDTDSPLIVHFRPPTTVRRPWNLEGVTVSSREQTREYTKRREEERNRVVSITSSAAPQLTSPMRHPKIPLSPPKYQAPMMKGMVPKLELKRHHLTRTISSRFRPFASSRITPFEKKKEIVRVRIKPHTPSHSTVVSEEKEITGRQTYRESADSQTDRGSSEGQIESLEPFGDGTNALPVPVAAGDKKRFVSTTATLPLRQNTNYIENEIGENGESIETTVSAHHRHRAKARQWVAKKHAIIEDEEKRRESTQRGEGHSQRENMEDTVDADAEQNVKDFFDDSFPPLPPPLPSFKKSRKRGFTKKNEKKRRGYGKILVRSYRKPAHNESREFFVVDNNVEKKAPVTSTPSIETLSTTMNAAETLKEEATEISPRTFSPHIPDPLNDFEVEDFQTDENIDWMDSVERNAKESQKHLNGNGISEIVFKQKKISNTKHPENTSVQNTSEDFKFQDSDISPSKHVNPLKTRSESRPQIVLPVRKHGKHHQSQWSFTDGTAVVIEGPIPMENNTNNEREKINSTQSRKQKRRRNRKFSNHKAQGAISHPIKETEGQIPDFSYLDVDVANAISEVDGNFENAKESAEKLFKDSTTLLKNPDQHRRFILENTHLFPSIPRCELYTHCLVELRSLEDNCTSPTGRLMPGLPKRRVGECNRELVPKYQIIDAETRRLESLLLECILQDDVLLTHIKIQRPSACSDTPASLSLSPNRMCHRRVRQMEIYCRKLEDCCPAVKVCRQKSETSVEGAELKRKRRILEKDAEECQIKSYKKYEETKVHERRLL